jgi:hypothetical protein
MAMLVLVSGVSGALAAGDGRPETEAPIGERAPSRPGTGRSDLESVAPPRGLPVEQERDLGRGPTRHEPVFLEPATVTTEHTRFGASAWIAPAAPFDRRENPGGPAIGFTITWSTPATAAAAPDEDP